MRRLTGDEINRECLFNTEFIELSDVQGLVGLINAATCPQCDGSGAYPVDDGHGGCEAAQCQWCHEKDIAIKELQ